MFGYVFRTGEVAASFARDGDEEVIDELLPHFEAQLATGEYPHIEELFGDGDCAQTWELIVETMIAERALRVRPRPACSTASRRSLGEPSG